MVCIPFCILAPHSFFRAGPETEISAGFVTQLSNWLTRSEGLLILGALLLGALATGIFAVTQRKTFTAWAPRGLVLLSWASLVLYAAYQAGGVIFQLVNESLVRVNVTLGFIMGSIASVVSFIFVVAFLMAPVVYLVLRKPVYHPTKY